LLQLGYVINEK